MADPTPPPDAPEPASPNPASPAPEIPRAPPPRPPDILPDPPTTIPPPSSAPAAPLSSDPGATTVTPGPRRIRSLPDRPGATRLHGTGIRSVPDGTHTPGSRLPGSYAASYGGDPNWKIGVTYLWSLFFLIALGEAGVTLLYFCAGFTEWPTPIDTVRLAALCVSFLALWFGRGWTRWVLVAIALLEGARTIIFLVTVRNLVMKLAAAAQARPPDVSFLIGLPLALGGLYLLLAGFLAFSAHVIAFTKHRWEAGRRWVLIPIGLLLAAYLVAMLCSQFLFRGWLHRLEPSATRLCHDDSFAFAEHWDPASFASHLDPAMLRDWPPNSRATLMDTLRPIGSIIGEGDETTVAFVQYVPDDGQFRILGSCDITLRCADGRATLHYGLTRSVFGPWRVVSIEPVDIHLYNPPPAAPSPEPAASPEPGVSPTLLTSSPSPGISPSPSPGFSSTPAASPSPGVSPVPRASPPPLPSSPWPSVSPSLSPMPALSPPPRTPAPPAATAPAD